MLPPVAVRDDRRDVHFYDRRDGTPLGELRLADVEPHGGPERGKLARDSRRRCVALTGRVSPRYYLSRLVLPAGARMAVCGCITFMMAA